MGAKETKRTEAGTNLDKKADEKITDENSRIRLNNVNNVCTVIIHFIIVRNNIVNTNTNEAI